MKILNLHEHNVQGLQKILAVMTKLQHEQIVDQSQERKHLIVVQRMSLIKKLYMNLWADGIINSQNFCVFSQYCDFFSWAKLIS